MKNYSCFNYDFLFGDHFAKVSNEAKLYYIKLNFFADNGFVASPKSILDSLGYDIGVFNELVKNGEILSLPDRDEIFIAAYFIHNKGLPNFSWRKTPYFIYWENKLYVKANGVADFNKDGLPKRLHELEKNKQQEKGDNNEVKRPLNYKIIEEKEKKVATEKKVIYDNSATDRENGDNKEDLVPENLGVNADDYDDEPVQEDNVDIIDWFNKE